MAAKGRYSVWTPADLTKAGLKLSQDGREAVRIGTGPGETAELVAEQMPASSKSPSRQPKLPTKTEREYETIYLRTADDARYEGLTFKMANGHRYTPDFVSFPKLAVSLDRFGDPVNHRIECIEVKGTYRLQSYQRARLAFDQARVEWPQFDWTWAEKLKGGGWRVTRY